MTSVEQESREEIQEARSEQRTNDSGREKTASLRSKRRGRYVPLVDKSSVPSLFSNLSEGDTTGISPETLDLVREFERRRKSEKKDRVKRRRALNIQRSKIGGKKR